MQRVEQWLAAGLALGETLWGRLAVDLRFDGIESGRPLQRFFGDW
jgi:hypothetical protein